MATTVWKEVNRPLSIPRLLMDQLGGSRVRKISAIATEDGQVVLTRKPAKYDIKYLVEIGRDDDFVPTAVLRTAKINHLSEFKVTVKDGDIFVKGVDFSTTVEEKDVLKPRMLDL